MNQKPTETPLPDEKTTANDKAAEAKRPAGGSPGSGNVNDDELNPETDSSGTGGAGGGLNSGTGGIAGSAIERDLEPKTVHEKDKKHEEDSRGDDKP
jgi:hypothetical protein